MDQVWYQSLLNLWELIFGKMYSRDCNARITWLENQIIDLIKVVGELQTRFMLGTQGATTIVAKGLIQPSIPTKRIDSVTPMEVASGEKIVAIQPELSSPSVGVSLNKPTSKVICNLCNKEGHRR